MAANFLSIFLQYFLAEAMESSSVLRLLLALLQFLD